MLPIGYAAYSVEVAIVGIYITYLLIMANYASVNLSRLVPKYITHVYWFAVALFTLTQIISLAAVLVRCIFLTISLCQICDFL
jgi:hypothetical protein